MNIALTTQAIAESQPDTVAIYYPLGRDANGQMDYQQFTYSDLLNESSRLAYGLEAHGITAGMRAVLMVKPSLELFALVFAMLRVGVVPVIIDPGMGIKSLKICLQEAEPQAFVGIPTAHIGRLLLGWAKETVQYKVTVGNNWLWGGATLKDLQQAGDAHSTPYPTIDPDPDTPAIIPFTSGSTGAPKGVIQSHRNLDAAVSAIKSTYDIQPGEVDLPTFPIFALLDPSFGMTTVLPLMNFTKPASVDPLEIIEPIQRFNVTNMFGAPALMNAVGRYGAENSIELPSLKRVITAGAPIAPPVLRRFSTMLAPDAQIHSGYGASEALAIRTIGSHEILRETADETDRGAGTCVGHPVTGATIHIIRISDEVIETWDDSLLLPDGEIGEIIVQGDVATKAYYNRDTSTQLAKIYTADKTSFYHRMGDLGYFDDTGRLWFCGRKKHRVETKQGTLFTVPVEGVFNTHPKVFRTALVGVDGEPVLCVELEAEHQNADNATIISELATLASQFEHTQQVTTFLFHKRFPVDIRHNSKIFREKLAVWAKEQIR